MPLPGRVNFRSRVSSPARRAEVVERLPAALDATGIDFELTDGDEGALGLPRWTTVWFHAEHGDYKRLRSDVLQRLDGAGLAGDVAELIP